MRDSGLAADRRSRRTGSGSSAVLSLAMKPCLPVNGRTAPSTPTDANRHACRALRTESLPLKRFHMVRSPRRLSSQRFDLVAGEMRHHRHGQCLAGLLGVELQDAGDRARRADGRQIGVIPAARRGRKGVEHGADHLVAHGQCRKQLFAGGAGPFSRHDKPRDHVARMAAVALPDEEIVVIVAAQQNAVGQRRDVRGRPQRGAPDHRAVRHRKSRRMAQRRLEGGMRQRAKRHRDRIRPAHVSPHAGWPVSDCRIHPP